MTNTITLKSAIDTRLEEALASSNYRITLNNQKNAARLKLEKSLTISLNGGTFKITTELISFISSLLSVGQEDAILMDVNKNPISIDDLLDFQSTIISKYYECMNEFMAEYNQIKKSRTTKALVGE